MALVHDSVNLATAVPTFCVMTVLTFLDLTGHVPKFTASGRLSTACRPSACTGTMNFSRSVTQMRSTL